MSSKTFGMPSSPKRAASSSRNAISVDVVIFEREDRPALHDNTAFSAESPRSNIVVGDVDRREDAHDRGVARAAADQHAVFLAQRLGDLGTGHRDAEHRAVTAQRAGDGLEHLARPRLDRLRARRRVDALQDLQRRVDRRARKRAAAERRALIARFHGLGHIAGCEHYTRGEARADGLGGRDDVGHNAPALAGEPVAGARRGGLDLVEDQQRARFVARIAQPPRELGGHRAHAAHGLDGLDDHRGAVTEKGGVEDLLLTQVDTQMVFGFHHELDEIEIVGRPECVHQGLGHVELEPVQGPVELSKRLRPSPQQCAVLLHAAHGQRTLRAAVEAAVKRDDVAAPCRLARDLQRRFVRLRARVDEERLRSGFFGPRREPAEPFGRRRPRRAVHDVRIEQKLLRLLLDRFDHRRGGVAQDGDGVAAVEVEVLGAVHVDDGGPQPPFATRSMRGYAGISYFSAAAMISSRLMLMRSLPGR